MGLTFLLAVLALVLAVVALRRTEAGRALLDRLGNLESKNGALTRRIWQLETEVKRLGQLAGTGPDVAGAGGHPEATSPPPPAEDVAPPRPIPEAPAPPQAPPLHPPVELPAPAAPLPRARSPLHEESRPRPELRPAPPGGGPPQPPSLTGPFVRVDWEQWLGVKGAAVLGSAVLALAGLLFFKYSIEKGWITPAMRFAIGVLVGLGCVAGSERAIRKRYAVSANALAGAGIVILYGAFWAGKVRYHLFGSPVAFVLMTLVTVACCLLAIRHASLLVALLGLAGGFSTPLLLSTGVDRPIALFGYILMLDAGFLLIARRRQWSLLAILSLAGTLLYQFHWIGFRMGPDRLGLGIGILVVFAVVFAFAGRGVPAGVQRRTWWLTQATGILLPFFFALYFASSAKFGPHLYPVAAMMLLLSVGAGWMGRQMGRRFLGLGAASGCVAVVAAWLLGHRHLTTGLVWEAAAISFALAIVFHLFVEREPERAGSEGPAPAAMVAATGFLFFLLVASARDEWTAPWPWLAGWIGLAVLLVRHAGFRDRAPLHMVAALGLGLGLWAYGAGHTKSAVLPDLPVWSAVIVVLAAAFQPVALTRRSPVEGLWAERSAAALALVSLLPMLSKPMVEDLAPPALLVSLSLLALLAALAATRLGSGPLYLGAVAAAAVAHSTWTGRRPGLEGDPGAAMAGVGLQLFTVLLFSAWPFLAHRSFRKDRWAWIGAALAGPLFFLSLKRLWEIRLGSNAIGLLPILLGALSLDAAWRARKLWPPADPLRKSSLVWFSAVSLGFVSVAIPLQLEKEWITIGWAIEALAVTVLWRRLDHPGLKWFALALAGGTTLRLIANPAVLDYYPRSAWRIVNWLAYTYLVPAAALVGTAILLGKDEVKRARPWEATLYAPGKPLGAIACSFAAVLVVFVWINLAIADWFSAGRALTLSFQRMPARDAATSIAWALYALVLLGIGMARKSKGLRWASMVLMFMTIAKAFLHDLGKLEDLYRVLSLLGLALSLIVLSLLYQRFVFRKAPPEGEDPRRGPAGSSRPQAMPPGEPPPEEEGT